MWRCHALILMLSLGLATSAWATSSQLTVATGEYPPFTDSTKPDGGVVNARVAEVGAAAGFDVTFRYLPWMRALELTRQGRFTATSYFTFSEARTPDFIHVGPVVEDRIVFFRRSDTPEPEWETLADLGDLRFGAVPGYTYTAEFWQLSDDGTINVEFAQSDEANMRKLLAGRIDLFIMSETSGLDLVDRLLGAEGHKEITALAKPLAETKGYLLVSRAVRDADDIAARMQTVLDGIRTSGD